MFFISSVQNIAVKNSSAVILLEFMLQLLWLPAAFISTPFLGVHGLSRYRFQVVLYSRKDISYLMQNKYTGRPLLLAQRAYRFLEL